MRHEKLQWGRVRTWCLVRPLNYLVLLALATHRENQECGKTEAVGKLSVRWKVTDPKTAKREARWKQNGNGDRKGAVFPFSSFKNIQWPFSTKFPQEDILLVLPVDPVFSGISNPRGSDLRRRDIRQLPEPAEVSWNVQPNQQANQPSSSPKKWNKAKTEQTNKQNPKNLTRKEDSVNAANSGPCANDSKLTLQFVLAYWKIWEFPKWMIIIVGMGTRCSRRRG